MIRYVKRYISCIRSMYNCIDDTYRIIDTIHNTRQYVLTLSSAILILMPNLTGLSRMYCFMPSLPLLRQWLPLRVEHTWPGNSAAIRRSCISPCGAVSISRSAVIAEVKKLLYLSEAIPRHHLPKLFAATHTRGSEPCSPDRTAKA